MVLHRSIFANEQFWVYKFNKGPRRTVTAANFCHIRAKGVKTIVRTVWNKRFLPINMQPNKERPVYSTSFAHGRVLTYVRTVLRKQSSRASFVYAYLNRNRRIISINHYKKIYNPNNLFIKYRAVQLYLCQLIKWSQ